MMSIEAMKITKQSHTILLQATGFDLEQAVGLHFAQQGDDGGASHGNKASAASTQPHPGQAMYSYWHILASRMTPC